MATVEKRQLTAEEEREAARLMAAWHEYKTANVGATQAWLGAASGLGSQGAVGQYLRGIIPLNVKALLAICRQIGIDPKIISPRLTKDIDSLVSEEGEPEGALSTPVIPAELQQLLTAYNQGGPAKQEALKRLAELPEAEMATLLLVIQSIGAKYKT